MRVAAIDIGTNSIHLVVADILADGEVQVIEKAREQVELGSEGGLTHRRIEPVPFRRGIEALLSYKAAIDSLRCDDVVATATSAVREASNGRDFCREVRQSTGIHVRVISGVEEARLVYLGVRPDLDFSAGPAVLLDLGGGSLEVVLCDRQGLRDAISLPLGHLRLTHEFLQDEPTPKRRQSELREFVRSQLMTVRAMVPPRAFGSMVGTSGAIRTLARMATLERGARVPAHDHGLVLHHAEAEEQTRRLLTLRRSRNTDLPGMDPRRRETLAAAAVVVAEAMDLLEAPRLITSERSLREGLLQEWVLTHRPYLLPDPALDPRTRSVHALAGRYGADRKHAETTNRLALSLFDQLGERLGLQANDRVLLGHAAYLHDIGHHIAGADHNEHGAYLVRHSRLYGFTEPEIHLLSLIIRYHRGSKPKKSHPDYGALPKEDRHRVSALSALLRLADGLDRSHEGLVSRLQVQQGAGVQILAWATQDAHLERWATESRAGVLSEVLGCPVQVQLCAEPGEKALTEPAASNDLR